MKKIFLISKSADLSKPLGRFFSNFVYFSESPNFTYAISLIHYMVYETENLMKLAF